MSMRAASGAAYGAVAKRARGLRVAQKHERKTKFIQGAVQRPGALTAAVGGKPSQHLDKVRALAKNGTPLQKKQAEFYLNVLRPAAKGK